MLDIQLKPIVRQATFSLPGLRRGHVVRFSDRWPENSGVEPGRTYRVVQSQQVYYERGYTLGEIPDFVDVDLSNSAAGEKLYPEESNALHEIFVGFKSWNGFVQLHSPQNQFIYQLAYTGMFYNLQHPTQRYIGAIRPYQSPFDDPRIRLFFVFRQRPFYIRIHVEGVRFDKAVLVFYINRLNLEPVMTPTPEERERALFIPDVDEVAMRLRIPEWA